MELEDAAEQDNRVLVICETTDLIGAIEAYVGKYYGLTIYDLIQFSNCTKEAFKEGKRKGS